jgi:tetratricopeptide (TPR) repeat protein
MTKGITMSLRTELPAREPCFYDRAPDADWFYRALMRCAGRDATGQAADRASGPLRVFTAGVPEPQFRENALFDIRRHATEHGCASRLIASSEKYVPRHRFMFDTPESEQRIRVPAVTELMFGWNDPGLKRPAHARLPPDGLPAICGRFCDLLVTELFSRPASGDPAVKVLQDAIESIRTAPRSEPLETLRPRLESLVRVLMETGRPVPVVVWVYGIELADADGIAFIDWLWNEAVSGRWPCLLVLQDRSADGRAAKALYRDRRDERTLVRVHHEAADSEFPLTYPAPAIPPELVRLRRALCRVLGWSSPRGERFLHEFLVELANEPAALPESPELIDEAWGSDGFVAELRFRGVRATALRRAVERWRGTPLGEVGASAVSGALRRVLARWIDNCFDSIGSDELLHKDQLLATANLHSHPEGDDIHEWASQEFPIARGACTTAANACTAMRARVLRARAEHYAQHDERSAHFLGELEEVDWSAIPVRAISGHSCGTLSALAASFGLQRVQKRLLEEAAWRSRWAVHHGPARCPQLLMQSLHALASMQAGDGELALAEASVMEAIELCKRWPVGVTRRINRHELALGQAQLAEIYEQRGRVAQARALLVDNAAAARIELEASRSDPKDQAALTWLAQRLQDLGRFLRRQGHAHAAVDAFRDAVDALAECGAPHSHWSELADSRRFAFENLGYALAGVEDHAGAVAAFKESLAICRAQVLSHGDLDARVGVQFALGSIAHSERCASNIDAAEQFAVEYLSLSRELAAEIPSEAMRSRLALALCGAARVDLERGRRDEARDKYCEARAISAGVVEETPSPQAFETHARILAELCMLEESMVDAPSFLKRARETMQCSLMPALRDAELALESEPGGDEAACYVPMTQVRCRDEALRSGELGIARLHAEAVYAEAKRTAKGACLLPHSVPLLGCLIEVRDQAKAAELAREIAEIVAGCEERDPRCVEAMRMCARVL